MSYYPRVFTNFIFLKCEHVDKLPIFGNNYICILFCGTSFCATTIKIKLERWRFFHVLFSQRVLKDIYEVGSHAKYRDRKLSEKVIPWFMFSRCLRPIKALVKNDADRVNFLTWFSHVEVHNRQTCFLHKEEGCDSSTQLHSTRRITLSKIQK